MKVGGRASLNWSVAKKTGACSHWSQKHNERHVCSYAYLLCVHFLRGSWGDAKRGPSNCSFRRAARDAASSLVLATHCPTKVQTDHTRPKTDYCSKRGPMYFGRAQKWCTGPFQGAKSLAWVIISGMGTRLHAHSQALLLTYFTTPTPRPLRQTGYGCPRTDGSST